MSIPSYDDLTPSIPDVEPGERLAVAPWLSGSGPVAGPRPGGGGAVTHGLFAALYGTAIDRLAGMARDVTPRFERRADGTVIADVAGLQRLLGTAASIAAELARAGAPRVAVATTQMAAALLVRTYQGITVATGDPEGALQAVPIPVLRELVAADARRPGDQAIRGQDIQDTGRLAWPAARRSAPRGRAASAFDVLRGWGVTTLGELAALPADGLAARLGAAGVALQRLARGLDPRPLVPDPGVRRFIGTFELEWPVETLQPLSFVFARLLDPLAAALVCADRGAVALHLTLRLIDRTSHVRLLQLPAPLRDPRVLRTLLLLDLESHPPPAAVDAIALELDPAPARIVQYSLLERAQPSPDTVATLLARLGALVGEARCGSPALLDTHRPDACVMRTFLGGEAKGVAGPVAAAAGDRARLPCVLRRFRPPVAVRVTVDGGRPVRVAIDRQGLPGGAVRQAAGPWRTTGGWWEPAGWNRDEWEVALGDGTVCRLVRDRDGGQWFMDGVVD